MYRYVPDDARVMFCQFRGDPNDDARGKWRARVLSRDAENIDTWANVYFCVSAMRKNVLGEFRRRKENFAGGLCLMIDDLGTKFPLATIDRLEPTALVETSEGNFQAQYFFDGLLNEGPFNQLIKAFITKQFLGKDPGMAGVNRVFRPPIGVNGKPKYNGWVVNCWRWHPENRYSLQEIVEAFSLVLAPLGRTMPHVIRPAAMIERAADFDAVKRELTAAHVVKAYQPDMAGWTPITCPWITGHGGGLDNGTGITEPNEQNQYFGGFKCFHDSCKHKRWRDLARWVDEESWEVLAERLERINAS
jgi:hypothetical protein